jgi:hypothetical protein
MNIEKEKAASCNANGTGSDEADRAVVYLKNVKWDNPSQKLARF